MSADLRERVARAIARAGTGAPSFYVADAVLAELKQELQPQAEPVAWGKRDKQGGIWECVDSRELAYPNGTPEYNIPLYAAPHPQAARVPPAAEPADKPMPGTFAAPGDWTIPLTPWSMLICNQHYAKGWNACRAEVLAAAPQPQPRPQANAEYRATAKRNLRSMIERGSADKALMIKCLEELS